MSFKEVESHKLQGSPTYLHTHTYTHIHTHSTPITLHHCDMIGCNNGGGGGNFAKVKRLAAKWIGTRKQL